MQNQLNNSTHAKREMDNSLEEKITEQANNQDFNFNQEPVRLKRMDSGTVFIHISDWSWLYNVIIIIFYFYQAAALFVHIHTYYFLDHSYIFIIY